MSLIQTYFQHECVEFEYYDHNCDAVIPACANRVIAADEDWIVFEGKNQETWALRASDVSYIVKGDNSLKDGDAVEKDV